MIEPLSETNIAIRDITKGSIGGAVGLLASQPYDVVKVRIQTGKFIGGMNRCFLEILKKENVRGLYKGMAFPLYGQVAVNAIAFGVEGKVERMLPKDTGEGVGYGIFVRMIGGFAAGAVQSIVCSPMELVKIGMQLKNIGEGKSPDYRGPLKEARNIWRQGGIRGIYSGLWVTIIRDSTGFGTYFAIYYALRQAFASTLGLSSIDELNFPSLSVAGGLTCCTSWIFNYPVEIIKTLIQEDAIKEMIAKENGETYKREYIGVLQSAKRMVAQNRLRSLYGGLRPCLVKSLLNGGTLLPTSTYVERKWPFNNDSYIFGTLY